MDQSCFHSQIHRCRSGPTRGPDRGDPSHRSSVEPPSGTWPTRSDSGCSTVSLVRTSLTRFQNHMMRPGGARGRIRGHMLAGATLQVP